MTISIFALIVNIGGNLLLIPPYGITGAAIASSTSYGILTLSAAIFYSRLTQERMRDLFLPRRIDWFTFRDALSKWRTPDIAKSETER